MKCLLILLAFVLLQVHLGLSLKCYQCNSKDQADCEELVDEKYLKECGSDGEMKDSPEYKVCRKIDQWVDFEVLTQQPFKRVLRQCGILQDEKVCLYKAGLGARVHICECTEPGCNSASLATLLPATIITALIAFLYSSKSC